MKKASKTKKRKTGKGKTTKKHSGGPEETHDYTVRGLVVEGEAAFVGVRLGMTLNIGDHEFAKVEASLTMPSDVSEDALDDTFEHAKEWCDSKVSEMMGEVQAAFGSD